MLDSTIGTFHHGKMKVQRTCIFCGNKGGISKEHFWPDWLSQYYTNSPNDGNISELHAAEGMQPRQLQFRKQRQGSVLTKKIRAVCKSCNNGWMSVLEEKIKPVLVAGIHGHSLILSKAQLADLAHWACVKSILGEHAEGEMALTPSEDRYLVFKQSKIPDYFRIFIGRHSALTQLAFLRQSTTVSRKMDGPNPPLSPDISRNIQSITFLVGPIFFHVLAARVNNFDLEEVIKYSHVERLWPQPVAPLNISTLAVLHSKQLGVNILDQLFALPGVKYGGPLPTDSANVI